jgi:hypothetical protein
LKGAHALLAGHHEVSRGKPFMQRYLAALIQRADGDRERFSASVALVEAGTVALAPHEGRFIDHTAMRTNRTIRPKFPLHPFAGLSFVMKDRLRKITHSAYTTPCSYYVKVIIPLRKNKDKKEDRTEFVCEAVVKELKRRERQIVTCHQSKRSASGAPQGGNKKIANGAVEP